MSLLRWSVVKHAIAPAPIVQGIEHKFPKLVMQVRVLLRVLIIIQIWKRETTEIGRRKRSKC